MIAEKRQPLGQLYVCVVFPVCNSNKFCTGNRLVQAIHFYPHELSRFIIYIGENSKLYLCQLRPLEKCQFASLSDSCSLILVVFPARLYLQMPSSYRVRYERECISFSDTRYFLSCPKISRCKIYEANKVPIRSHIWVDPSTFKKL